MKCDYQTSHLARTFTSPCFGRDPKARVVTMLMQKVTYCCMQGLNFELIDYTPYRLVDGFSYDLMVKSLLLSTLTFSLIIHGGLRFIISKHEISSYDLGHEFLKPKYEFHLPF
jgi:hypothetical protein